MGPKSIRLAHLLAFGALVGLASGDLSAQRGGRGGGQARTSTGTHHKSGRTQTAHGGSTHRSTAGTQHGNRNANASNVNRGNGNRVNNGNINTGNVNVNTNGGYGNGYGYGYGHHPVARGVVAGATTAAIMGHYYNTLPSGCSTVTEAGIVYHHCGSSWYRTQGNQYVVVQQP